MHWHIKRLRYLKNTTFSEVFSKEKNDIGLSVSILISILHVYVCVYMCVYNNIYISMCDYNIH